MEKRTEEFKALANILLALAFIGIVMCCIASNELVGYIGVALIAIGFLGGISFDSLAEMTGGKFVTEQEANGKCTSKQLDELRNVQYSFLDFLKDNGCTLQEFIHIYDDLNLNINYVYDQYQLAAGDDVIQTREQVQRLMDKGRGIA